MRRGHYALVTIVLFCATHVAGCGEGIDYNPPSADGKPFIAKGKLKSDEEAKAKIAAEGKKGPARVQARKSVEAGKKGRARRGPPPSELVEKPRDEP
jgi:hypothetical protein